MTDSTGVRRRLTWVAQLIGLVSTMMFGAAIADTLRPLPGASPAALVTIDLARTFDTKSPWRFEATQGPDVADPYFPQGKMPAPVKLCLQPGADKPCDQRLVAMPQPPSPMSYEAWEPHYLNDARIVYPLGKSGRALLLLQTASIQSADGDEAVFTQLLAYDRGRDRFKQVFAYQTGRNNNQEVRFLSSGPLRGDVIAVEPMPRLPYGYWVTVNRLTPAFVYKTVRRFRSATIYGDGNPLAVIDSEMPNIEQRLGLWRPGMPLPLPRSGAHPCVKPHLSHRELWCS